LNENQEFKVVFAVDIFLKIVFQRTLCFLKKNFILSEMVLFEMPWIASYFP